MTAATASTTASETGASLLPHRRALIASVAAVAALLAIELAMGRPPICTCGVVRFWTSDVQSAQNSQQVADWYSFSHVIHGLLFYFFAHVLWQRWRVFGGLPTRWALTIAIAFEGFWELLENSPIIIDRYRAVTVSFGYSGDSILNSIADVGWMSLGFLVAARLPAWASVVLALAFELFTLAVIRDNLTLNILMLVWPVEAVRHWQSLV